MALQELVHDWIDNIGMLVIAGGVIYNAWRTRQLEKNTNSIKDALVASTSKSGRLEGREEMRHEIAMGEMSIAPVYARLDAAVTAGKIIAQIAEAAPLPPAPPPAVEPSCPPPPESAAVDLKINAPPATTP